MKLSRGMLLLAVAACLSLVLWLMASQRKPEAPLPQSAHTRFYPHGTGGTVPGKQQEQDVLRMALKKSPDHAPVLLKLAQMESEDGRLKEAKDHLRRILKTDPANPEANLELGKVLFRLGDMHGAIDQTQAILNMHPNYEDALYNLGAIYANIGNRQLAMEYWNRLATLHSNSESAQRAQRMMVRLSAGIQ
jgi:tetratricopeptide (TPR) repeat protein